MVLAASSRPPEPTCEELGAPAVVVRQEVQEREEVQEVCVDEVWRLPGDVRRVAVPEGVQGRVEEVRRQVHVGQQVREDGQDDEVVEEVREEVPEDLRGVPGRSGSLRERAAGAHA